MNWSPQCALCLRVIHHNDGYLAEYQARGRIPVVIHLGMTMCLKHFELTCDWPDVVSANLTWEQLDQARKATSMSDLPVTDEPTEEPAETTEAEDTEATEEAQPEAEPEAE